mmetsp:Transcript_46573/g.74452  ORF Transcript_46573/g.74452 Transcript_46573/m.74452 type:complete len:189 (+) Transcript_46573:364-930(+)
MHRTTKTPKNEVLYPATYNLEPCTLIHLNTLHTSPNTLNRTPHTSKLHTAATKVAARNEKAKIKRDTDDFLRTEDQRKALKTDKNKKAKVRRDTADFHRTEDQRVAFKTDKKKKAQIKLDTADFLRTEDQRVAFQENKALREKEWREYNDRLRTEDQRVAFKADTKAKRAAYLAKKKLERLGEEGGEA